ncbi:MAG: L-histidine N(alpha)-methyltransferase [Actinomycetota bacterium]
MRRIIEPAGSLEICVDAEDAIGVGNSYMTVLPLAPPAEFAAAVHAGLSSRPKTLPCRYFYDEAGSDLFERICELPEYYVTRTEDAILRRRAAEIAKLLPAGTELVELGSGSSTKTRRLIEALLDCRRELRYVPIDISGEMLQQTARRLSATYPSLTVAPLALEYDEALQHLTSERAGPMLVLFLGSNLGNFDPEGAVEFLRRIRRACRGDDRLLLGLDLQKDAAILNAAYDDAQGVTARFNLNLLRRINRELGADFHIPSFRHRAFYNQALARVEMHLVSERAQRVHIAGRSYDFAAGESIHTESSHKYSPGQVHALAAQTRFTVERAWQDEQSYFSVNLLRAQDGPRERGVAQW